MELEINRATGNHVAWLPLIIILAMNSINQLLAPALFFLIYILLVDEPDDCITLGRRTLLTSHHASFLYKKIPHIICHQVFA